MSDTPKLADECKKLLDNGATVVLFHNSLGSYTAAALYKSRAANVQYIIEGMPNDSPYSTDDFEPSQALYRLTEKVFGNIV